MKNILPQRSVSQDLFNVASTNVLRAIEKGNSRLNTNLSFEGVTFFNKSKTAGYVIPSVNNIVYLNADLFANNLNHFVKNTIPHEVAHLFAESLNARRKVKETPHGRTWRAIMQNVFGVSPTVRHSLDLSGISLPKSKYKYICACSKHFVGKKIHSKIQKGSVYRCRSCKSSLTFLSKND